MRTILVAVKEPGKDPEAREIPATLEAMQEIVGGYVERLNLDGTFDLFINEEGRFANLDPNLLIGITVIVGTVFITALPTSAGNSKSLTAKQLDKALGILRRFAV